MLKNMTTFIYASDFIQLTLHCHIIVTYESENAKYNDMPVLCM